MTILRKHSPTIDPSPPPQSAFIFTKSKELKEKLRNSRNNSVKMEIEYRIVRYSWNKIQLR